MPHLGGIPDVAPDEKSLTSDIGNLAHRLTGIVLINVADDDSGTLPRERDRCCPANSLAGTSNHDDFPRETPVAIGHVNSLSL
jgi:hypothetical protein